MKNINLLHSEKSTEIAVPKKRPFLINKNKVSKKKNNKIKKTKKKNEKY